jgi:hypothetical protein
MRAISIAAIATALVATAPLSAAADQIITESFSVTIPNTQVPDGVQQPAGFSSTAVPLFDPAAGQLKSVNVTLNGSVTVASFLADPDIGLFLKGGVLIDSDILHVSGTSDFRLSGNDKTSSYIGSGFTGFLFSVGSGDNTPNASLIESVGALNGLVPYTYTLPTLALPETPTWASMLIGFATLGFVGCRAKRKAAVRV